MALPRLDARPSPARAVLSWRLAVAIAVTVSMRVGGLGWPSAIAAGVGVGALLVVVAARPRRQRRATAIDPFTLGEPWRHFVRAATRSADELHRTVRATPDGPLRDRLATIAARLDHALEETWEIARRGDEVDAAVRRLDPTRLRSTLDTLSEQRARAPSADLDESIASVEHQLETTDRLRERSERIATQLRLSGTRLGELTVRAAEVSIGAGDTEVYRTDVEDLVVELESLRLAIEETNRT
jgi:hypothetical protein